jgi:hypothetical protein
MSTFNASCGFDQHCQSRGHTRTAETAEFHEEQSPASEVFCRLAKPSATLRLHPILVAMSASFCFLPEI